MKKKPQHPLRRMGFEFIVFGAALAMICAMSPAAFADTVQGKIANKNTSGVNLAVYDAQGRPYPNFLRVEVKDPKQLASLRTYDWVKADVKQTKNGVWRSDKITRIKTPQVSASGEPFAPMPQPSPSLAESLKSPQARSVIRGGLMGALTGAVASGSSGGKAGKGALIGAGLGAVSGLLQNILGSSPPPPQYQYQQPVSQNSRRIVRHYNSDGKLVSEEEVG